MSEPSTETTDTEKQTALGTGAREAVDGDPTKSYIPTDEVVSPTASVVTGDVVAETQRDAPEAPDQPVIGESPATDVTTTPVVAPATTDN